MRRMIPDNEWKKQVEDLTSLLNGYTSNVASTKKIYWHSIYISNDTGFRISMNLITDNNTPFIPETWEAKVKEILDDGKIISINGAVKDISNISNPVNNGYLLIKSNNQYQIRAFSSSNNNITYVLDTLLEQRTWSVTDSVYAIN